LLVPGFFRKYFYDMFLEALEIIQELKQLIFFLVLLILSSFHLLRPWKLQFRRWRRSNTPKLIAIDHGTLIIDHLSSIIAH